jgi:hypothetical protein
MTRPKLTALFVLMSTPVALGAQPDSKTEPDYDYCDVSSEEVVAGTSEQAVAVERWRGGVHREVAAVRERNSGGGAKLVPTLL